MVPLPEWQYKKKIRPVWKVSDIGHSIRAVMIQRPQLILTMVPRTLFPSSDTKGLPSASCMSFSFICTFLLYFILADKRVTVALIAASIFFSFALSH